MGTEALLQLLLHLAVGRLCLSLLPPGWPGYHDRRELGPTLCASLMLGLFALRLIPWAWIWGVLLLLRLSFLPGALRPRHDLARDPALAWELAFIAAGLLFVDRYPGALWLSIALGLALLIAGWQGWTRRADRRARALAILGVLTPVAVYWL